MTRHVLFIDPAYTKPCAVASFENGNLVGWESMPAFKPLPYAGDIPAGLECYYELPDVRGHGARSGMAIKLAAAGAWVAGYFRPVRTEAVPVKDWKGTAPKPQVHGRIYAALTSAERTLLPANTAQLIDEAQTRGAMAGWPAEREWYRKADGGIALSDTLDAIGGGLWVVGRFREKSGKASPYVHG